MKASGRRTRVEVGMKECTGLKRQEGQGIPGEETSLWKDRRTGYTRNWEGSVTGMGECQDQVWGAPSCPSFLAAQK